MTHIVRFWLSIPLLLVALAGRGQETDSLFFRADSLRLLLPDSMTGMRPPIILNRMAAESFMHSRVPFTSEFFRRFNGQMSDGKGEPVSKRPSHPLQIRALFDAEDQRLTQPQSGGKQTYGALVDAFVADAGATGAARLLLDPDEHLYADVVGSVGWQQREQELRLYLKKTRTGASWYWEIIGVDAPFLTTSPEPMGTDTSYRHPARNNPRDSLVFIAPNAHELNFMGLARQLRSGCGLESFVSPATRHDRQLTALAHTLETGQLRLHTLLTTTLWLDTQWGWLLQLRFFSRETENSGWLISDVCRSDTGVGLPPALRHFMNDTNTVTKP